MERDSEWIDPSNSALTLLPEALLPQDGGSGNTLDSPTFFHIMPRAPPASHYNGNSTSAPPVTTTPGNPKICPACGHKFSRWQDRDRHISIHLPHWIHCPLPHCAWRGNLIKSIKLHWKRQDHLKYHESYGDTLSQEQFEIFDPQPYVNQIKAGTISASDAAFQALFFVDVKAAQLQKSSMSENPWGYKLKSAPLLVPDPQ
jgi:hypothetical protein